MNYSKKIVLTAAVGFFSQFAFAQSVQEGTIYVDSHKYAKARQNFNDLITKDPSANNYFYLGNTYLTQFDPNFDKAKEYFDQGLAKDPKNFLSKIGLASIKLGKGDKSGETDLRNIVKDSKEKDAEVLYRAAEALTLYDKTSNPDLAVEFLNKAIEKSQKAGVPANYYYALGDAYRLKSTNDPKMAGNALSAYENALPVAKSKASVYTRIATLWMAAQQWQKAKENLDKAIAVDPSYAPAYKALAGFDIKYQRNAEATQDLIKYSQYADEDPSTQLEIAKLYFTNEDYANAKTTLDKVFDKVDDPVKYKLRSYIQFGSGEYVAAKENLDKFVSLVDKSRVLPADQGLYGLIAAGLAKDEKDAAKKAELNAQALSKIAIAKAAKDETFKWDDELAKVKGGFSAAAADQGPTNAKIEELKKKVAANQEDTTSLAYLAQAYQEAKNWNGAVMTWQKLTSLLPDWAPAYNSLAYAYQQGGNTELANTTYQKFIDLMAKNPAEAEANKESLSYAYFAIAYANKDSDKAKAKDYANKAVALNPTYQDAVNLVKYLSK
ncbi:tetratricopeptide repeat protein [Soonwooa sp.]|uniref:tetratricopeptide repeat protein n=1 Tax=Soonwooa sp. TaxID=1938592 RepID=UPI00262A164C|nr:tetratricopeptide repeat protein [Soonwooa sp.]